MADFDFEDVARFWAHGVVLVLVVVLSALLLGAIGLGFTAIFSIAHLGDLEIAMWIILIFGVTPFVFGLISWYLTNLLHP